MMNSTHPSISAIDTYTYCIYLSYKHDEVAEGLEGWLPFHESVTV